MFSTRLGYLGADFGNAGKVVIGKQWSVYYDVTGYTDKFNVFGGQGSATYVGNSDGGGSGTGRVSQALSYRNQFGKFLVGAQLSMRSALNGYLFDGFGLSAQYELLDGLRIGSAYVKAYFEDEIVDNTSGLEKQPEYMTFGFSYINVTWDIGAVYSIQHSGDYTEILVEEELIAAVFNAHGYEILVKYKKPRYSIIAGYNDYDPDADALLIDPDFKTQYFVLGVEYKPSDFPYLYIEYRLSNSINQRGGTEFDVFTVGLRIDLEREWSKRVR